MAVLLEAIEKPHDSTQELIELVAGVDGMPGTARHQASALWQIILEGINAIGGAESKRRVALRAGLGVTWREGRFIKNRLAAINDRKYMPHPDCFPTVFTEDKVRRIWTNGLIDLAQKVSERIAVLNDPESPASWNDYAGGEFTVQHVAPTPIPPRVNQQPLHVNRLIVSCFLQGRAISLRRSEWWVRAVEDDVTEYKLLVYSPEGGNASATVRAVHNCRTGTGRPASHQRKSAEQELPLVFPRPLGLGELHFFAAEVTPTDLSGESTVAEVLVTNQGIAAGTRTPDGVPSGGLTIRLQFDDGSGVYPRAAWWFADVDDITRQPKPASDDPRRLRWSRHGFVAHTFKEPCHPGKIYGIVWEWPS